MYHVGLFSEFTSLCTTWRSFLNSCLYRQGGIHRWTDDSPLTFTKWSITGHIKLPFVQYARYKSGGDIYTTETPSVVHDALQVMQPFTANNTRLCASVAYHDNFEWIMVPCNYSLGSVLHICETSATQNTAVTLNSPDSQQYSPEYAEFELTLEYWHYQHGSVILLKDLADAVTSMKRSDCGIHCGYAARVRNPYCSPGWILTGGKCFRMTSKGVNETEMMQSIIRSCVTHHATTRVNMLYIIDSDIMSYLSLWSIPREQRILLLDEVHDNSDDYICQRFTQTDADNDLLRLDWRELSELVRKGLKCSLENIEHFLCFQEPILPTGECPSGTYQCGDDSCISDVYRCDSQYDCPGGDDERQCASGCHNNDETHAITQTQGNACFHCGTTGGIKLALVSTCVQRNALLNEHLRYM